MGGAWRTLRRGCCEAVVVSGVARERRWVVVMVAFEYWRMQPLEPAGDRYAAVGGFSDQSEMATEMVLEGSGGKPWAIASGSGQLLCVDRSPAGGEAWRTGYKECDTRWMTVCERVGRSLDCD